MKTEILISIKDTPHEAVSDLTKQIKQKVAGITPTILSCSHTVYYDVNNLKWEATAIVIYN